MASVFTSTIAKSTKATLEDIMDDDTDGIESKLVMKKLFKVESMEDEYEDDQEYGGGGLVSEKAEGGELSTISMKEGFTKRYRSRTYGARMIITREAMEDAKYKEVINLGRRLKRAIWKTVDYDATLVFARAENSDYVGGDGKPLSSSTHTLPNGGTFSNRMATPLSPSKAALVVATTQMGQWPSQDGLIEGAEGVKVTFPLAQWAIWSEVLNSKMTPELGNYAEINVANHDLNLTPVKNKYWQNTTTNWAIITDADNGLKWKWRRRPDSHTWVDNDNQVTKHSVSARWDRGWSNARGVYFVAA